MVPIKMREKIKKKLLNRLIEISYHNFINTKRTYLIYYISDDKAIIYAFCLESKSKCMFDINGHDVIGLVNSADEIFNYKNVETWRLI